VAKVDIDASCCSRRDAVRCLRCVSVWSSGAGSAGADSTVG